jgi:hypothetical protein
MPTTSTRRCAGRSNGISNAWPRASRWRVASEAMPGSCARRVCGAVVRSYREAMREFGSMRSLDLWYARVNVDDLVRSLQEQGSSATRSESSTISPALGRETVSRRTRKGALRSRRCRQISCTSTGGSAAGRSPSPTPAPGTRSQSRATSVGATYSMRRLPHSRKPTQIRTSVTARRSPAPSKPAASRQRPVSDVRPSRFVPRVGFNGPLNRG